MVRCGWVRCCWVVALGIAEVGERPRRADWNAGLKTDVLVDRRVGFEERLVERADAADAVVGHQHVERHAPLVERDEKAAEAVVDGVDVVEQAERVGLAPGQDLPADAHPQPRDLRLQVGLEEPVAEHRHRAQAPAGLADIGKVSREGGNQERVVVLVVRPVLGGTVIVDAFVLAAVGEMVLEALEFEGEVVEERERAEALFE